MLAGVATRVGAGAKNKLQRFGAVLEMDQFVGEVVALELANRQLRVVWTVFDQQDFGLVFSDHSVFLLFWQSEVKRGALVGFGFGPDASPVPVEDALDQGEVHTGSFKFVVVVQALEDAKELPGVLWIEPHPVVLDIIEVVLGIASTADFNHG